MAGSTTRVMGTPIVFERAGKKAKKKRSRFKDAEQAEKYIYRAVRRSADAADRGARRYEKARTKSAGKRRDGAVLDVIPNMAKGMTTTAGRLTPVPLDLLRAANTASVRRTTRRTMRATARMLDTS